MIAESIRKIIDKLKEKTKAGQTTWNQSSGSNGYRLSLQSGTINIDKWYDERENDWAIDLKIFNDNGDAIEYIEATNRETKSDFDYLDSFYSEVRRKVLKVDETLKGFLDELNGSTPIGRPENPNNNVVDDLPF